DLDPRARIEIRDLLLELRSLGKTVFLSSHILTELSDVCTSIGILERGRLVVAGPINEIASRLEAVRAAQATGNAPAHYAPQAPGAPQHAQRGPAVNWTGAPLPAQQYHKVKLRVLGDPEMAAYFLRGGPGIVDIACVAGVLVVQYAGTEAKIAEIVQH